MIELKNVSYIYENNNEKVCALNNVSIKIEKGEFWGIIGHTGSGKSTLTEIMSGLLKPSSGEVLIDGEDIGKEKNAVRRIRGRVGMVFQYPEHQLFEETVLKDVCFGAKNMGLSESECEERGRDALRLMGLGEEYENRSPFELSGGEKRRVAIAGVIAMRPKTLILDEPAAGLDPVGRDALLDTLMKIKGTLSKSIVMVSHSMEDVARCCDKVLVLNDGSVAACDCPREVFKRGKELEKMGLDVPQITRLVRWLNDDFGCDINPNIISVEEATEELYKKIKEMGKC